MNYTLFFGIALCIIFIYSQYDNIVSFNFRKSAIDMNNYKQHLLNTLWFKYKVSSGTLFSNYYTDKDTYEDIKKQSLILKKYI